MVVAVTGGSTRRRVRVVLAVAPPTKVAVMGQLKTPVKVGVPVICPVVLLKVSPVGRLVMFQVLREASVLTTAW